MFLLTRCPITHGVQMPKDLDVSLKNLPAVFRLANCSLLTEATQRFGVDAVTEGSRRAIDAARRRLLDGGISLDASVEALAVIVEKDLQRRPELYRRVLNATGVLLHTNIGRAPIPPVAFDSMRNAADYSDLEMDLSDGKRASRLRDVGAAVAAATGAATGLVVNNNAAAVLLTVSALANDKPTAISRGHQVEIGGGFRMPTILGQSSSPIIEVGSTNRTHLRDYQEAIERGAELILLVHHSNFEQRGYVSEVPYQEVVALCKRTGVRCALDLGSGALVDMSAYGLPSEYTVQRAVHAGFDAICFSGDKLTGGPQAGIIAATKESCERIKRHPLARAVRCDKLQLAGVVTTLGLYSRDEHHKEIPLLEMLAYTAEQLRQRAEAWAKVVGGRVVQTDGAVGGGSLPGAKLPGFALALPPTTSPHSQLTELRALEPPIIAHIENDEVLLHPRTIAEKDDESMITALAQWHGSS